MSYPSGSSDGERAAVRGRMREPVPKGALVDDGEKVYRVLEDTTKHGAPWVEVVDPKKSGRNIGDKMVATLYLHVGGVMAVIEDKHE